MVAQQQGWSDDLRAGIAQRVRQIALMLVFIAAVLFVSAGRLDWPWAWAFLALYVAMILANAYFLLRASPETIARRASAEGVKAWDRVIGGLWALAGTDQLVVAGLDYRFGWTAPLSLPVHGAGLLIYLAGSALFSWAMIANAYFAAVVRVQVEQGHAVCTTGPYAYVRHPGYAGAILQAIGLPLLLGTLWALLPGLVAAGLMVVRTVLEDRTLHAELPGYREFAQRTRHRLLPGVW